MEQDNINNYLLKNGIRPLRKRTLIYDYLITKKNHPTVETIYKDLLPKSPSLSKTTVYNVLNLFLEKNMVQTINIEGNELRYDADINSNGHFKCSDCGQIFDFKIRDDCYPKVPLEGFVPHNIHYYVVGQCANCTSLSFTLRKQSS